MNATDSVGRFDGRASDYARYRPSYPSAAIDAVLAGLGPPAAVRAIDAGAGTGLSTQLLAARGVRVTGLEPNAEMRARAAALGLTMLGGTVRENALLDGEADLVTAFQAFHWFADAASARALARLLRPGGRLALVWNLFDRRDAFTDAYCSLLDRHAEPLKIAGLGLDAAAIERAVDAAGFVHRRSVRTPYVQTLDEHALLGRLRSSSSAPTAGAPYEAMAGGLHDITRGAGAGAAFALVHQTEIVLAERPL